MPPIDAPVARPAAALSPALADSDADSSADVDTDALHLLNQVGREVAGPLTAALERVNALAAGAPLDRDTLQALREDIERARRAGKVGQQLARFAAGRIRARPERCSLSGLLRDTLRQRQRELQARGVPLRAPWVENAELDADPTLIFSLLNALLDWCAEHTRSDVDLRLALQGWPTQARLTLRFVHTPAGDLARGGPSPQLDTLSWQLARECAQALGLGLQRVEEGIETQATATFPNTLLPGLPASADAADAGPGTAPNSQPLAGTHVLAVAARREVRQELREALQHMGLILDFVPSLAEAQAFCRSCLPHAIVYEGALGGQRFNTFRETLQRELPQLVFVEVTEEGREIHMARPEHPVARLGRPVLAQALPGVLVFEIARGG